MHRGISLGQSFFKSRSLPGQCLNIVFLSLQDWVNKFEKPNTAPNSLQPSTTVLSPYVMFGCLSARLFYHRLSDIYSRVSNQNNFTDQCYIQAFLSSPVNNAAAYTHLMQRLVTNLSQPMKFKSHVFPVFTYTYIVSNCCIFYRLKSTLTHQFLCMGSFCGENFSSLQHMELLTLTRWRVIVSACKFHGTTIQSLSKLGLRCVQYGSSDENSKCVHPM